MHNTPTVLRPVITDNDDDDDDDEEVRLRSRRHECEYESESGFSFTGYLSSYKLYPHVRGHTSPFFRNLPSVLAKKNEKRDLCQTVRVISFVAFSSP